MSFDLDEPLLPGYYKDIRNGEHVIMAIRKSKDVVVCYESKRRLNKTNYWERNPHFLEPVFVRELTDATMIAGLFADTLKKLTELEDYVRSLDSNPDQLYRIFR